MGRAELCLLHLVRNRRTAARFVHRGSAPALLDSAAGCGPMVLRTFRAGGDGRPERYAARASARVRGRPPRTSLRMP